MSESAFPVQSVYIEDQETNSRGMTLRDYFAAKAMQGFISASTTQLIAPDIRLQARSSYFVADEMLKARGS
jgi:hypothetical protein